MGIGRPPARLPCGICEAYRGAAWVGEGEARALAGTSHVVMVPPHSVTGRKGAKDPLGSFSGWLRLLLDAGKMGLGRVRAQRQ